MLTDGSHVSDQELLSAVDGELSPRSAALVRSHLESCWDCRARKAEIEAAIVDFTSTHRRSLDPQLPPIAGSRALLRARLAELAAARTTKFPLFFPRLTAALSIAAVCMALLAALWVGSRAMRNAISNHAGSTAFLVERGDIPDPNLTPGATRSVSMDEICSMPHEEVIKEVSASLRQKVFAEYGIEDARPDDYEVDYLIAPGLGGAEDIHNLWPEPYHSDIWNAYAKDALEERLHQLVCSHEIDLPTAQREITTDWIAAYKKYFHSDKPVFIHAHLSSRVVFGFFSAALERRIAG